MLRRWFALSAVTLGLIAAPAPGVAARQALPGPSDAAAAAKAGRDAGPEPAGYAKTQDAALSYRVFATQYNPNTSGSVEVAVPDKCAKFAALRWTSALSSAGCPSGYSTGLDWRVIVRRDSGQQLRIPVKEVGPWNQDDNYWDAPSGPRPRRLFADLQRGMPEAQAAFYDGYHTVADCKTLGGASSGHAGAADQFGRCVLNPAGIDLSVAAAAQLGMPKLQNEWVTVTFLWENRTSRQPHVLWHDARDGKVRLWIMSKTNKVRGVRLRIPKRAKYPPPEWSSVATADINRDRHLDVLWWNRTTNKLVVWLMDGTRRVRSVAVSPNGAPMSSAWRPFGIADLNHDRRPDVLWHNTQNGHVAIWFMNGTTRKRTVTVTLPAGRSWPSADQSPFAAARIDGDNLVDIAWHSTTGGQVSIWYMSGANGAALRSTKTIETNGAGWPAPARWTPVGLGDFSRDGELDLLWHNTTDGSLRVWTMGGADGATMSSSVAVNASSFPEPAVVPVVWL